MTSSSRTDTTRDRVVGWALDFARDRDSDDELIAGLARLLVDAGIPLVRVSASFRPIDPVVWARNISWEADLGVQIRDRPYGDLAQAHYIGSVVEAIYGGSGTIRDRIEQGSKFQPIDGLSRQGATDYLAQPIDLGPNVRSFVSYAIARGGGFTAEDIAILDAIHPAVASVIRLRSTRLTIGSVLRTYLGPNAAQIVQAGRVRRGHGEQIHAAIWFCDLRDFTVLSQALPPDQMLQLLDAYFEAVSGPVVDHGGEILKFIGDAMLAIFPVAGSGAADSARRAVTAAVAALDRFATDVAQAKGPALGRELGMGLALHVGEVFYGNIGARDRLDFTVIGPAVNMAARVQGQCTAQRTPLLLTGELAALLDRDDLVHLEGVALKGIETPTELVTLARYR
ncbi:MAG: adenylate/guanylate cyclase domain-containing protein [Deltaproteobacteria bacterium]|nr:adenylate/guanylate cyclase domain-containing protein [Deltaproteobacteria bacterium]